MDMVPLNWPAGMRPFRHKDSVLLPAPDGPVMPRNSPLATSRLTPASASRAAPGYLQWRSRQRTARPASGTAASAFSTLVASDQRQTVRALATAGLASAWSADR